MNNMVSIITYYVAICIENLLSNHREWAVYPSDSNKGTLELLYNWAVCKTLHQMILLGTCFLSVDKKLCQGATVS